jgi:hypothetical protein
MHHIIAAAHMRGPAGYVAFFQYAPSTITSNLKYGKVHVTEKLKFPGCCTINCQCQIKI